MKTLSVINAVQIIQLSNDLIPITPFCQALGIDESTQRKKINEDDFYDSIKVLSPCVGADKKEREMLCLPLAHIFGWLATINPKNVKEEARESVRLYRMKCCEVIHKAMYLEHQYLKDKEVMIEDKLKQLETIRKNFKNAKFELDEANNELKEARTFTFDDWEKKNNQYSMFEQEGFIE